MTSPPGTWVTDTIHVDARLCRGRPDPGPLDPRDDLRVPARGLVAVADGIAPLFGLEARRSSASRARRAFSSAAFFARGGFFRASSSRPPAFRRPPSPPRPSRRRPAPPPVSQLRGVRVLAFLSRAFSCCEFLCRFLLGFEPFLLPGASRSRPGRVSADPVPRAAARVRAPAPARAAASGLGVGGAFGRACFRRRSSPSMASVCAGGGRCFQVNQPKTAAATMHECSSIDSANARQRPWVSDFCLGGICQRALLFLRGLA